MGILGDGHGTANLMAGGLVAWLTGGIGAVIALFALIGGLIWVLNSPISKDWTPDPDKQVATFIQVEEACDKTLGPDDNEATSTSPECKRFQVLLNK
jgi:hypothetical protein